MKNRLLVPIAMFALTLVFMTAPAIGQTASITPSTNDANRTTDWAYFDIFDRSVPGEVMVQFSTYRALLSCFEVRIDGDESGANAGVVTPYAPPSYDGLYQVYCVRGTQNGETVTGNSYGTTFLAKEYVEIRLVIGDAPEEFFDWTRIDVLSKDSCMNGGWEAMGFENQGQCVRYINTGVDLREP